MVGAPAEPTVALVRLAFDTIDAHAAPGESVRERWTRHVREVPRIRQMDPVLLQRLFNAENSLPFMIDLCNGKEAMHLAEAGFYLEQLRGLAGLDDVAAVLANDYWPAFHHLAMAYRLSRCGFEFETIAARPGGRLAMVCSRPAMHVELFVPDHAWLAALPSPALLERRLHEALKHCRSLPDQRHVILVLRAPPAAAPVQTEQDRQREQVIGAFCRAGFTERVSILVIERLWSGLRWRYGGELWCAQRGTAETVAPLRELDNRYEIPFPVDRTNLRPGLDHAGPDDIPPPIGLTDYRRPED